MIHLLSGNSSRGNPEVVEGKTGKPVRPCGKPGENRAFFFFYAGIAQLGRARRCQRFDKGSNPFTRSNHSILISSMDSLILRVASRYQQSLRTAKKQLELSWYDLEGVLTGQPVTLYHGSTRLFHKFDMSKSREDLVKNYYGSGIFLTPSKKVAGRYAEANRNIGFEPEIIDDLKSRNRPAGEFMQDLFSKGNAAWDDLIDKMKELYPDEAPGVAVDKYLGVDGNTINDVCGYIIDSKIEPLGRDAPTLFSMSSGAPDYVYDNLDEIGIDSSKYRPKIYTVSVTVKKPLITASKAQAKSARSKGYDSVVFYGSDLVDGVPEVAVFDPGDVRIKHVEVL